jgi:hypothetical protein
MKPRFFECHRHGERGWELRLGWLNIEKRRKFTTSGVEHTVEIYRFARWDYIFIKWVAG